MGELARFRCHKIVRAGKIRSIGPANIADTREVVIEDCNGADAVVVMPESAFGRKMPSTGDFVVVYDDGWKSWSPAQAFEEGYTRMDVVADAG